MRDKIVELLKKKQDYVSGEEISQRLGISRQGLWKHIQELRDSGYDIVAIPHLGYHLEATPDRLYPSEISLNLNTKFIGKKFYYFDSVGSTMDNAMQLGLKGAPEGTIILSETQSKGRGRLGRGWSSPKYKGIYFSLILRPKISPNGASIITLLAAVSICEAIKHVLDLDVQIKWPNDLLLQNKKIAGILTEISAETDEIRFITIGAGLNVNNDKKSLVSGAYSLRENKKEDINRIELLQEILRSLENNYLSFQNKGSAFIIDKWRNYNITLGKRVKISSHKEQIEGEAIDIDVDGALLVRKDSGIVIKLTAGDVVHCR